MMQGLPIAQGMPQQGLPRRHAPAGPSATGHARLSLPPKACHPKAATAKDSNPNLEGKRPGSPLNGSGIPQAHAALVGQRRRQFGCPRADPFTAGARPSAQPFRFSHRCHREQLG